MNELLLRRRVASAKPYDAEVEWIQADGGAYIDTGIKAAGNLVVKTRLINYFSTDFYGKWAFGGRNAYNNTQFGILIEKDTNKLRFAYQNRVQEKSLYSSYPNPCDVEIGGGTMKIGTYKYNYTQLSFTSNYNLWLFALNNGGRAGGDATGLKMGAVYISNGTTTLDLIPVRVGTEGYMYDKLSGKLFGNSRDIGNFIPGNDVTT